MTFAHQPDEMIFEETKLLDIGRVRQASADVEVNLMTPDSVNITNVTFGRKPQRHQRSGFRDGLGETGADRSNQRIAGPDDERSFKPGRVEVTGPNEQRLRLLNDGPDRRPKLLRSRCRDETATGPHEDGVVEHRPDPGQGMTHRGDTQMELLRRSGHTSRLKQTIQGGQQVEIDSVRSCTV